MIAWKTGANASATTSATYALRGRWHPPAISASGSHALAVRSDGVVWGWGENASGQLGDGTQTSPRLLPQIVSGLTGALALSTGEGFSHVLREAGSVVAFGWNQNGRLGDGTTTARLHREPTSPGMSGVVSVGWTGTDHTIALLKGDGSACRRGGSNGSGLIGDGTDHASARHRRRPVASASAASAVAAVVSLLAGAEAGRHGAGVGPELVSGQLGDSVHDRSFDRRCSCPASRTAAAIAAGQLPRARLARSDGTVQAPGAEIPSASSATARTRSAMSPVAVAAASPMSSAIAAGDSFSVALKDDGTVWTWGTTTTANWATALQPIDTSVAQVSGPVRHRADLCRQRFCPGAGKRWHPLAPGARTPTANSATAPRPTDMTPVAIAGTGMNWRVGHAGPQSGERAVLHRRNP